MRAKPKKWNVKENPSSSQSTFLWEKLKKKIQERLFFLMYEMKQILMGEHKSKTEEREKYVK